MIGLFKLIRHVDVSGVSGTGVVAFGALFPNGKATLSWNTDTNSVAVYDCMEDLEKIHLHGGASSISWIWRRDERDLEYAPSRDGTVE